MSAPTSPAARATPEPPDDVDWNFQCPECDGHYFFTENSLDDPATFIRRCNDQNGEGCRWRGPSAECDRRKLDDDIADLCAKLIDARAALTESLQREAALTLKVEAAQAILLVHELTGTTYTRDLTLSAIQSSDPEKRVAALAAVDDMLTSMAGTLAVTPAGAFTP